MLLGQVVGPKRAKKLKLSQALVLSFGAGTRRVLAQVSVQKLPKDKTALVDVFINVIDPKTGSNAPNDIMVGNVVTVRPDQLYFPKTKKTTK